MNRRLFVATIAAGAVGTSAGCLSGIINDATTFEAFPVRVSTAAADEAGYEYKGTRKRVEEREFAGESVEVTNYLSEYTRTLELPLDAFGSETEAGVFALISTPQVSVAGESFNPVGEMSTAELAEHVQNQYDKLEIGSNIGGRALEPDELDVRVSFDTYEGAATLHGEQEINVLVDIAQPDHDSDHLVLIGVYPDEEGFSAESEQGRIDTMVAGLEHSDDVDVDIVEEDGDGGDNETDENE
ncbi:DUF6517 family protein [Natronorubrum halophilum]|uniref:DUF6517 family protein n=1 Tax=Natronorubrum halophilum TaxID=1702106 RepID=UPI001EE97023|nr:DUF6517 family protein [Natronorubrum halophilum]